MFNISVCDENDFESTPLNN